MLKEAKKFNQIFDYIATIHGQSDENLYNAIDNKYFEVAKYLIYHGFNIILGSKRLHEECEKNPPCLDTIKFLINHCNIKFYDNWQYNQILTNMCENGHLKVLKYLIKEYTKDFKYYMYDIE